MPVGIGAAEPDDAHDRIVVARKDGAIVAHDGIGDACKLAHRFPVVYHDGLVMNVSRGHDQHVAPRRRAEIAD